MTLIAYWCKRSSWQTVFGKQKRCFLIRLLKWVGCTYNILIHFKLMCGISYIINLRIGISLVRCNLSYKIVLKSITFLHPTMYPYTLDPITSFFHLNIILTLFIASHCRATDVEMLIPLGCSRKKNMEHSFMDFHDHKIGAKDISFR